METLTPRGVISYSHRGLGKSGPLKIGQGSFPSRSLDVAAVAEGFRSPSWRQFAFIIMSRRIICFGIRLST